MVKHVDHFPGDSQKLPLLILFPVALSGLGKFQKFFQWRGLPHTSFLCLFILFVGLKLLTITIAVKHRATALPNLVLVSVGKDLKASSQTLHGQTFSVSFVLYLCASVAPSNSMNSPTSMRNCQLRPINLSRYLSCSVLNRRLAQWTINVLSWLDFLEIFLPQWLHFAG